MDRADGNMIIGKRKIQSEMRKRKDAIPSCQDGKMTKSIEIPQSLLDGRRNTVFSLTQIASVISRYGASAQHTRNSLTLGVNDGAKNQDRRNIDLISHEQLARLPP